MADEVDESEEEANEAAPEVDVETLYGVPLTRSRDQVVLHPAVDQLVDTVSALRDDGFNMLIDVTAVDYLEDPVRVLPPGVEPARFELVVGLISHAKRERVRLRVQVDGAEPTVPSLFDVFPGAEALERETFDMFGIVFDGHPDMSRILMPDDWYGHPLRKDYGVGAIPVQFKGAPGPR